MATIQAKTLRIAAPLGSLYCKLDAVIRGQGNASLSLPEVMTLVEKTILLTGQANNACLYSRRMNILRQVVGDSKQSHKALNNHKELLRDASSEIFGVALQDKSLQMERKKLGRASLLQAPRTAPTCSWRRAPLCASRLPRPDARASSRKIGTPEESGSGVT